MVTISLVIASLFIGVYDLNSEGGREMFFYHSRPRTLALILSGASMAVVGLIMQVNDPKPVRGTLHHWDH